ncbi:MAG: hypothetical protein Q7W45_08725 [Bacteroidota bacterium]|nr:hypothetical protein [Bacteroidota bacterium]MDP3144239.1 hypothetical protein [Bacteroidota bacterium]
MEPSDLERSERHGCNGDGERRSGFKDGKGCREEACANCKMCDKLALATFGKTVFAYALKNLHEKQMLFWFGASFCFA